MKIIRLTSLILFLGMTPTIMGQNSSTSVDEYECIYEYQVKNDKGSSDVTSTILQIGRNIAMFSDYTAFRADSAIACKAPETDIQKFKTQEMRNDMFFDQSVSQMCQRVSCLFIVSLRLITTAMRRVAHRLFGILTRIQTPSADILARRRWENMAVELGWFGIPPRYLCLLVLGNFVVCQGWYWRQRILKAYISSRQSLSASRALL